MTTESELAAVAVALIGSIGQLTSQERKLIGKAKAPAELVDSARALIAAGDDPLG